LKKEGEKEEKVGFAGEIAQGRAFRKLWGGRREVGAGKNGAEMSLRSGFGLSEKKEEKGRGSGGGEGKRGKREIPTRAKGSLWLLARTHKEKRGRKGGTSEKEFVPANQKAHAETPVNKGDQSPKKKGAFAGLWKWVPLRGILLPLAGN